MIEVSAETGFVIYLAAAMVAIIGIWLYQHKKGKAKEIICLPTKTYICEFCSTQYLAEVVKPFTRCPECHSLNKNIYVKNNQKKPL
ncbi:MAG TPA: hypothetical protein VN457_04815 [Chlamydiales bacterium]|nr:hypothetical protein [Chlamydiales bacterium]